MSSATTNERTLLILLFDQVERDDLMLRTHLQQFGFKTVFVGVNGGQGVSYQFTPRVVGEDTRQNADISLAEASGFGNVDALLIPGGPGALMLERSVAENIGSLVDAAQWVVAFSLGANLLASSGRLNGKEATTHHSWAGGNFLEQWPTVSWKPKDEIVRHEKFITAFTIPKSKTVEKVAQTLVSAMGLDAPVGRTRSPSVSPGPSTSVPAPNTEQDPRWKSILDKHHEIMQQKIATGDVEVNKAVLEADPFYRPSATETQIREAEERLDVTLPDDYKLFLRTSDGTGFSGQWEIPGLEHVAELQWDDAYEMGFEALRLEVPLSGSDTVDTTLAFERVLRISDPDLEEYVCLVEPAFVARAKAQVAESRGETVPEASDSEQWNVFFFVPWAASYKQFSSFTAYMESKE